MSTSTNMDVDPPEGKRIAVHPLAIVHMSDQYTRITCGGSPLDKTAPVVGLLFGTNVDSGRGDSVLQIKDADDIPTDLSETSILQVELHRAVFPQHVVVGWYRVSKEEEPTPNDLLVTQQLQNHYQQQQVGGGEGETTQMPLLFCLLQVQTTETSKQQQEEDHHNLSQELPINLYELHTTTTSTTTNTTTTILLGLNHWDLETSDPERIAVERVMREQPLEANHAGTSTFATQSQSVQHSLCSMKDRIAFLVAFLKDVTEQQQQQGSATMVVPHSLLRDVQGLIYSLGPLAMATRDCCGDGGDDDTQQDALLLSHLAAVAKTTSAVQSYTDKFRLLQENRALGKEMRRAF